MKKRIIIAAVLVMLCGCSDAETENGTETLNATSISTSVTAETEDDIEEDYDYVIENGEAHIFKYRGSENDVVIPESLDGSPVTYVSRRAFAGKTVVSLTLPETVKSIENFMINNTLERIDLSSGITELSADCFRDCMALREVNIADGGKYKSVNGAVYTADGKELIFMPRYSDEKKLVIPDGVERIGDRACESCKITELVCPNSLKEIGKYAFAYADLRIVSLNDGLDAVDDYAFTNFSGEGIKELYLPDSVKTVGTYFVNPEVAVDAKAEAEGLAYLDDLDDVTYRDDTLLQHAIRKALQMVKVNKQYWYRIVFVDISGDDFPEMVYYPQGVASLYFSIYYYSADSDSWCQYNVADMGDELCYYSALYRDKDGVCFNVMLEESTYTMSEYAQIIWDESGELSEYIGESSFFYPTEYYSDSGAVTYYHIGGRFETKVYSYEELFSTKRFADFRNMTKEYFSDCELIKEIDFISFLDRLKETDDRAIYIGEFAAEPQSSPKSSEYDITQPERRAIGQIGGHTLYEDTSELYIDSKDLSYENFQLVSQLPKLTILHISGYEAADLSGIELLQGLKALYLSGSYVNADSLLKLKDLEWLIMNGMSDISFISGMDSVRVLEIYDAADKPADYFSPAYDMKGLEYLLVSCFELTMTDEQEADFRTHRPDVGICFYKVG